MDGLCYDEVSDPDALLARMHEEVNTGRYRPRALRRKTIQVHGKQRTLGIPVLVDRVVQYIADRQLALKADLPSCVYGGRPGTGVHDALRAVLEALQNPEGEWIGVADLKSFFPSIPLTRVEAVVEAHLVGSPLREALRRQLYFWAATPGHGLPVGAPLSPSLANLVMRSIDVEFGQRRDVAYVRYFDDALGVGSKQWLDDYRAHVERLGLELHPTKTRVVPAGVFTQFLGVEVRRGTKGAEVRITSALARLQDRISVMGLDEDPSTVFERVENLLVGWVGHYQQVEPEAPSLALEAVRGSLGTHPDHRASTSARSSSLKGTIKERSTPTETSANAGSTSLPRRGCTVHLNCELGPVVCEAAPADERPPDVPQNLGALSDTDLGTERVERRAWREFLGAELQRIQVKLFLSRQRRRAMRDTARRALASAGSHSVSVDAVLHRSPGHVETLDLEHMLVAEARRLNDALALVRSGIAALDREMAVRAMARGFVIEWGRVHQIQSGRARRVFPRARRNGV